MAYRVILQSRAQREFTTILEWLAKRSPVGAARWLQAYDSAITQLETTPLAFPLAPESELASREVRQVIFRTRRGHHFRMLYSVVVDEVFVLHIRGPGQPLVDPNEL